jgi:hypothetical protein
VFLIDMLSDCKICANKNTQACLFCTETSGGKPSMYKEAANSNSKVDNNLKDIGKQEY